MSRMPIVAVALIGAALTMRGGAAEKLTPAQLLDLHARAVHGGAAAAPGRLSVRGTCELTTVTGAGALKGSFTLSSDVNTSQLAIRFLNESYEGESIGYDGHQVQVGFAQPRIGARSAMGLFLSVNQMIVREGLLGGVLNGRWPLFDPERRPAKLSYDGLKKLEGQQYHRLNYRVPKGQGDLTVHLFFEPDTYRHVASVYQTSYAQGMGATPESSSRNSELHYRLEERFSDFTTHGTLSLPSTWRVRYERSGNTTSQWRYDLTVDSVEEGRGGTPMVAP